MEELIIMKDTKRMVGENIKKYIDSVGRTHQWVIEKAGIPKATFYKLLKGEGDLIKGIEKINDLFGITDAFYFYREDFQPPETLEERQKKSDIRNFAAANYVSVKGEEKEFQETLETLDDFIRMIELLKLYDNMDNEN